MISKIATIAKNLIVQERMKEYVLVMNTIYIHAKQVDLQFNIFPLILSFVICLSISTIYQYWSSVYVQQQLNCNGKIITNILRLMYITISCITNLLHLYLQNVKSKQTDT